MFKEPGQQIKLLAKILTVLLILLVIVLFAVNLKGYTELTNDDKYSFVWLICGLLGRILGIWFGGLLLYGFGDLIENVSRIAERPFSRSKYTDKLTEIGDEAEKFRAKKHSYNYDE